MLRLGQDRPDTSAVVASKIFKTKQNRHRLRGEEEEEVGGKKEKQDDDNEDQGRRRRTSIRKGKTEEKYPCPHTKGTLNWKHQLWKQLAGWEETSHTHAHTHTHTHTRARARARALTSVNT